jgi:hypothetical protein
MVERLVNIMKAVDDKIVDKIYKHMKTLDSEELDDSKHYNHRCFSVFDHWLSEEEAANQIFSYQKALRKADTAGSRQYYEYQDRFVKFYHDLYNKTKVYGVLGLRVIVEFDSIEEYNSHVLLSVREQLFLKILLLEYSTIIEGHFDFRHLIHTLKTKPEGFQAISSIIKSHGLFVLN